MTDPTAMTDPQTIVEGMTSIEVAAIRDSIFLTGHWVLTTKYENHPHIMDDLSEDIADPVSGILTPLGELVRTHLEKESKK